jgi:hypothetical protein
LINLLSHFSNRSLEISTHEQTVSQNIKRFK